MPRSRIRTTRSSSTPPRPSCARGCCSAESNELRYGVKDTPSCRQNFLHALAPFGLGKKDIVAKAEQEAREAAEAEEAAAKAEKERAKADKKRLAACRRQKIDEADCPPLPEADVAAG